jgi:hypothetical protein
MIQWPSKAVVGTIELSLYIKWITKYHTVGTVPKSKIAETGKINTPNTQIHDFTFLACYICYMRNYSVGLMHIFRQVVYYGEHIVWLRRGFRIMMDKSSYIYNCTCLSSKSIPLYLCFCMDCLFWYVCSWYNFWRGSEVIS